MAEHVLRTRQDRLADFTRSSRIVRLSALALVVGAASALVATGLARLIGLITGLCYYGEPSATLRSPAENHLGWFAVAIPVLGGLAVGLMARFGSEKIRGHGIPEALEAILIGRSRIEAKVALLKPLSSAIAIGTGGPFGAEGPIVMTGGAFGSLFAQLFHLSAAERKTLLVAGAAGGMSAIFATPLAAVLLAVELLLFEWKPRSFIPVALASLVAVWLRTPLLGAGPLFALPAAPALGMQGLVLGFAVGLVAGLASAGLTTLLYGVEDLFGRLPIAWMWWPALGGVVVGVAGLVEPRVLGIGYDTIAALLRGTPFGAALIGLLVLKAIAWSVSLGSGTSGGVLAPLLLMGGALGAIEAHWLPVGTSGEWALIGMAAMMGGTMRAPFTAVVFGLELTHAFGLLPPMLAACVAAELVTVLLLKRSILTEKIARRGHHLTREYAVDPLETIRVAEVMDRAVPVVPMDATVAGLADRIAAGEPGLARHQAAVIVDADGRLRGVVTRGDLLRALEAGEGAGSVLDAGSAEPVVSFPGETVKEAAERMVARGLGRLPVVAEEDPGRLVGYFGREQALSARARRIEEENLRERVVRRRRLPGGAAGEPAR